MYFSFDNIALDKIIPAFQEYCRSVEERMIIVYDNHCLGEEEIIQENLSNENTSILLKKAVASMDAIFYIPIQFTMTLCSLYTVKAMKRTICNGIYRLINETVEFSTASGYSVMYVKLLKGFGLMCRMMDHEIKEGKLCLKEDDLVLYENRDEGKNLQSVVRLIIWIIIFTIVAVILLRKLLGTKRRRMFKLV